MITLALAVAGLPLDPEGRNTGLGGNVYQHPLRKLRRYRCIMWLRTKKELLFSLRVIFHLSKNLNSHLPAVISKKNAPLPPSGGVFVPKGGFLCRGGVFVPGGGF